MKPKDLQPGTGWTLARRAQRMGSSIIRDLLKLTQERPGTISFAGGLPSPLSFPVEAFAEACAKVLRDDGAGALQYSGSEGYAPLRPEPGPATVESSAQNGITCNSVVPSPLGKRVTAVYIRIHPFYIEPEVPAKGAGIPVLVKECWRGSMKTWLKSAAALVLSAFTTFSFADNASEAKALLDEAHAAVVSKGMTAAAAEINAGGKWKRGKAYVVLVNFDGGMVLAHADNPKIAGKAMIEAKDAAGKSFVKETIANVKAKGESLVEYRWANPTTKKIDDGRLMARRVPGQEAYVAVGFWE
jgi:hypothetical protein